MRLKSDQRWQKKRVVKLEDRAIEMIDLKGRKKRLKEKEQCIRDKSSNICVIEVPEARGNNGAKQNKTL